jgi:hypothetical protein
VVGEVVEIDRWKSLMMDHRFGSCIVREFICMITKYVLGK